MSQSLRQLPNLITLMRIALVVPFAWWMAQGQYDRALWTLLVAGVSDGVDGFLARRYHWQSQFGSIADPVADKCLLVTAFVMLGLSGQLPWWLVAVVVLRDVYIFSGALAYWFIVGRYQGRPTLLSKICTFALVVLGLGALGDLIWPPVPELLLQGLMALVLILCPVTMLQYTLLGVRGLRRRRPAEVLRG